MGAVLLNVWLKKVVVFLQCETIAFLLMADKTCRGFVVSVTQLDLKKHRILADMQRAITVTTLYEEANLGCLHC